MAHGGHLIIIDILNFEYAIGVWNNMSHPDPQLKMHYSSFAYGIFICDDWRHFFNAFSGATNITRLKKPKLHSGICDCACNASKKCWTRLWRNNIYEYHTLCHKRHSAINLFHDFNLLLHTIRDFIDISYLRVSRLLITSLHRNDYCLTFATLGQGNHTQRSIISMCLVWETPKYTCTGFN